MKLFTTTVRMFEGGYEKTIQSFRKANSIEDAAYDALVGETHNEPLTRKQHDNGDEWWDDCMLYRIDHVTECDPKMEAMLRKADIFIF